MKLLIITQKVDRTDDNLGSFHRWIEECAKRVEHVSVITNVVGPTSLPSNVSLFSLEKDRGIGKVRRAWKFLSLFSREFAASDAVFFHMIPEFVLAASPFLISSRKPSALWYVHKSVTWKLRWAETLAHFIVTASPLSFRYPSKKVIYTGHAIDTEYFTPIASSRKEAGIRMLTVGRMSPVKDIETMIQAASILKSTWDRPWSLSIVGGPAISRDHSYLDSLKGLVTSRGLEQFVHFAGAVPYMDIPGIYHEHDMFISMSTTGSIDKAVLEAMASGLTVITANEAFRDVIPEKYFLPLRSPEALAERIKALANENRPNDELRRIVMEHHSIHKTTEELLRLLSPHA